MRWGNGEYVAVPDGCTVGRVVEGWKLSYHLPNGGRLGCIIPDGSPTDAVAEWIRWVRLEIAKNL